ncbi:RnfABCDGE type electron transport complex subunit D [Ideonella sp.]|uniref:RnfABCDGE type electron transport complex subunit D n=1 Tax=Ideonella sp. TaxID=1929293 RepID=UPI0035B423F6
MSTAIPTAPGGLPRAWAALRGMDARLFQLLFQGSLLLVGALLCDFALQPLQVALTFATVVATQSAWLRATGLQQRGLLSALVTGFGLSLLVRADNLWVHPLLAVLAISSKFVWRYAFVPGQPGTGSAHRFNPANLGAIVAAYGLPGAWLSPGQWGHSATAALGVMLLGAVVSSKARRADASWVFLLTYAGLVSARALYLGVNPWSIWHQIDNGALLLFAFFMISDPMTTPRVAVQRVVFAALVALGAFAWQYGLFKPNGPIVALFVASFAVPWLNQRAARARQAVTYRW